MILALAGQFKQLSHEPEVTVLFSAYTKVMPKQASNGLFCFFLDLTVLSFGLTSVHCSRYKSLLVLRT